MKKKSMIKIIKIKKYNNEEINSTVKYFNFSYI